MNPMNISTAAKLFQKCENDAEEKLLRTRGSQ